MHGKQKNLTFHGSLLGFTPGVTFCLGAKLKTGLCVIKSVAFEGVYVALARSKPGDLGPTIEI
jgi:hypothetical protein